MKNHINANIDGLYHNNNAIKIMKFQREYDRGAKIIIIRIREITEFLKVLTSHPFYRQTNRTDYLKF